MSLVGILPIVVFWILGSTADPDYGWLLFFTLPFSLLLGAVGVVLGIVGELHPVRADIAQLGSSMDGRCWVGSMSA